MANFFRRGNALMSCFMHIPFPEDLSDDLWMEKFRQLEWLSESGLLGIKNKDGVD